MSDIFESKWGETKAALTEGLAGNKKKTMATVVALNCLWEMEL